MWWVNLSMISVFSRCSMVQTTIATLSPSFTLLTLLFGEAYIWNSLFINCACFRLHGLTAAILYLPCSSSRVGKSFALSSGISYLQWCRTEIFHPLRGWQPNLFNASSHLSHSSISCLISRSTRSMNEQVASNAMKLRSVPKSNVKMECKQATIVKKEEEYF